MTLGENEQAEYIATFPRIPLRIRRLVLLDRPEYHTAEDDQTFVTTVIPEQPRVDWRTIPQPKLDFELLPEGNPGVYTIRSSLKYKDGTVVDVSEFTEYQVFHANADRYRDTLHVGCIHEVVSITADFLGAIQLTKDIEFDEKIESLWIEPAPATYGLWGPREQTQFAAMTQCIDGRKSNVSCGVSTWKIIRTSEPLEIGTCGWVLWSSRLRPTGPVAALRPRPDEFTEIEVAAEYAGHPLHATFKLPAAP